jgi:hypothetical protein
MPPPLSKKGSHDKVIVTPETALLGKVVRVNNSARFAVINYPVGNLPGIDQRYGVYRQGLKVGEIKITGPQQDDNTVADIVSGEVQIGDETRPN